MAKPKSKTRKRKHAQRRQMRRAAQAQAVIKKHQAVSQKNKVDKKPGRKSTDSLPRSRPAFWRDLKMNWSGLAIFGLLFAASLSGLLFQIRGTNVATETEIERPTRPARLTNSHQTLERLKSQTAQFKADELKYNIQLADSQKLWQQIDKITTDISNENSPSATRNIKAYTTKLNYLQQQLITQANSQTQPRQDLAAAKAKAAAVQSQVSNVPILIYHYTPADFENQLDTLTAKGYTTITMGNLSDHLRFGRPLPVKPIVLTFDDGFSNQMQAFTALERHNMKATYYIITSGETSKWCIGAARRYDQTPGCGDAYMNWDEISQLDKSGLIEIGAHTVDHLSLPSLTPSQQLFQIQQAKRTLEEKLGHPVNHFAYPYGAFSPTTAEMVRNSGYLTAVTTEAGSSHNLDSIYTLSRERDIRQLP